MITSHTMYSLNGSPNPGVRAREQDDGEVSRLSAGLALHPFRTGEGSNIDMCTEILQTDACELFNIGDALKSERHDQP